MKIYIVMSYFWQYNDEIFNGHDAGYPSQAFQSEEKAKEFCKEKNLHEIYHTTLADFFYDVNDAIMLSELEVDEILSRVGKKSVYDFRWDIPMIDWDDFNDEAKATLSVLFDGMFFYIEEIDLDNAPPANRNLKEATEEERFTNLDFRAK